MDTEIIFVLSYLYDISPLCTSIVAKMVNGTIIHGRNLDFPGPAVMRSIAYVGQFYKDDEYIFDALMLAGDTGTYTGMRHEGWTVSENWRGFNRTIEEIMLNLAGIFAGRT